MNVKQSGVTIIFRPRLVWIGIGLVIGFLFLMNGTPVQAAEMQSMSEADLRMISGQEGLSIDTVHIDGKLDERNTLPNGHFYLGPITFNDVVIGQSQITNRPRTTIVDLGTISGNVLLEVGLENGSGFSPFGTLSVGGINSHNATAEVTRPRE